MLQQYTPAVRTAADQDVCGTSARHCQGRSGQKGARGVCARQSSIVRCVDLEDNLERARGCNGNRQGRGARRTINVCHDLVNIHGLSAGTRANNGFRRENKIRANTELAEFLQDLQGLGHDSERRILSSQKKKSPRDEENPAHYFAVPFQHTGKNARSTV